MASMEGPVRPNDRHARRRPFSTWMKRLANLKNSHTDSGLAQKRSNIPLTQKYKKSSVSKNNPYPLLGRIDSQPGRPSFSTPLSSQRSRQSSLSQSKHSVSISHDSQLQTKSRAPTLATTAETAISDTAHSGAGTSATAAKTDGDHNSTFSSPAPSLRSMTTTLTTIQSAAPPVNSNPSTTTPMGPPAAAIPAHLAPHAHPTTYHSATANNALSDDASILTLASSSKRRRRNSVDTNASMRALAPASMFGGSRESLPLSVLSGAIIGGRERGHDDNASLSERAVRPGLGAERASLISASGVTAPALASERNSYIGTVGGAVKYGDAASIRSGLLGGASLHGRDGSMSGSIGGLREKREGDGMVTAPTSPLVDGPGDYKFQSVGVQE